MDWLDDVAMRINPSGRAVLLAVAERLYRASIALSKFSNAVAYP
jgi:hypothetical protein